MTELDAHALCALSDGAGLLSLMLDFKRLPEVVEGVADGSVQADMGAIASELMAVVAAGGDGAETAGDLASDACSMLDRVQERAIEQVSDVSWEIRREHTRLFDDPDSPALPYYEGAFINRRYRREGRDAPDEDVLFINRAANDADRQYKRAHLQRDASQNIPADCMITEMAFLQQMAVRAAVQLTEGAPSGETDLADAASGPESAADALLREFVRLHMRPWAAEFFEELSVESGAAYFQAVGAWGCFLLEVMNALFPAEFRRGAL